MRNMFLNWSGQGGGSYVAQGVLIAGAIIVGVAVLALAYALRDKWGLFKSRVEAMPVPDW